MRTGLRKVTAKRASKTAKSTRVFGQPQAPAKMFRVGLYARVSTNDQQTLSLQMRAMREYAAKRGWTIALQIKEIGDYRETGQPGPETPPCQYQQSRDRPPVGYQPHFGAAYPGESHLPSGAVAC